MNIDFAEVKKVYIENYKPTFKTIIVLTKDGRTEINLHGHRVEIVSLPKEKFYSEFDEDELRRLPNIGPDYQDSTTEE